MNEEKKLLDNQCMTNACKKSDRTDNSSLKKIMVLYKILYFVLVVDRVSLSFLIDYLLPTFIVTPLFTLITT